MSSAYERLMQMMGRASRYGDMTVLITGETGTGKTRLARKIHEASPRARFPLVEIDCTAIPPSMAESELFGHERGAYTGADKQRIGKIRSADGGTVFLDEIGDLDLGTQSKLLKALDDRCVTPLGTERRHPVDVRIIAATNKDLQRMASRGEFRVDLLERLSQYRIGVPPLRERREDIRSIAMARVEAWNAKYGELKTLDETAMMTFEVYDWPGNVRELENAVTYACAQSDDAFVRKAHLPCEIIASGDDDAYGGRAGVEEREVSIPSSGMYLKDHLRKIEWDYFRTALRMSGGNAAKAASLLGMKAPSFRKALRERYSPNYGCRSTRRGPDPAWMRFPREV